jgi:hypothetical protein
MPTATPRSHRREIIDATDRGRLAITDGEINFLWSFIQGSVMIQFRRREIHCCGASDSASVMRGCISASKCRFESSTCWGRSFSIAR